MGIAVLLFFWAALIALSFLVRRKLDAFEISENNRINSRKENLELGNMEINEFGELSEIFYQE